jgi:enoyl-[acyl-carrier protein] reductase II
VLRTRVTEEYGIEAPIVLAPMGFVAMPPLVAAVSNAGGLGLLGASIAPPPVLAEMIRAVRSMTSAPFGAGFLVVETAFGAATTDEHIALVIAERLPVVTFHWELPSREWMDQLHRGGTRVWIQAGSVARAREAAALGADAVICQAAEAGGHNRSTTPLVSLLPTMVHAISPVPVIAAGGIGDGRALAAALLLGAEAASLGTRFIASAEANAHAEHKRRIVAAEAGDTAFTRIFGPEWPDGRVRALRNRVVDQWRGRDDRTPPQPEPPVCIGTTRLGAVEYRMPKFSIMLPTPETSGDFEEMCLLAGESAAVIRAVAPAGEIVRQLVAEAEMLLGARPLPSPGAVR